MRTSAIRIGDIVCCNKRGRVFHAKVRELDTNGKLLVEPIERNISPPHRRDRDLRALGTQHHDDPGAAACEDDAAGT